MVLGQAPVTFGSWFVEHVMQVLAGSWGDMSRISLRSLVSDVHGLTLRLSVFHVRACLFDFEYRVRSALLPSCFSICDAVVYSSSISSLLSNAAGFRG